MFGFQYKHEIGITTINSGTLRIYLASIFKNFQSTDAQCVQRKLMFSYPDKM